MQRVTIIGCSGAGKSTLAVQLGKLTGLPVHHLDALYWKPGWVETEKDEWLNKCNELIKADSWIIDGNYGNTMDMRLAAADTVINLDFPRWLCLYRVIKRWLQYLGKTRPDMGMGCPEKIDWEFIMWVWNFKKQSRLKNLDKLDSHAQDTEIITLRNPREVRQFLKSLEKQIEYTRY